MTEHNPAMDKYHTGLAQFQSVLKSLTEVAERLDKLADEIKEDADVALPEVAEFYFYLNDAHERADKAVKIVYHFKDMLNKHLIPTRLEKEGLDMVRVASIARSFSTVQKTSASFIDKEKGFEWLRGIGQGDIIQETVNAGTLSAFIRNMILEEGREPPADLVRINTYNTTSMVKYTPKKGV